MMTLSSIKIGLTTLLVTCIACAFTVNCSFAQNRFDPHLNPLTPRNGTSQRQSMPSTQPVKEMKVTHANETPGSRYVSISSTMPRNASTAKKLGDPLNKKLSAPSEQIRQPRSGFVNSKSGNSILKVIGGLSAVLAVFYAFTIFAKRNGAKVSAKLPADIIQVLGTMPIDAKRKFQLVRLGSKLLLLSVTERSVETVSEITDPVEVEYFVSRLQKGRSADAFNSMRQMMMQIRQQKRAQRMYPSQFQPEMEDDSSTRRMTGANVFEA